MTGCPDCREMRKYLERQPNREATTGQLEADLWRSRHKIGTHRRHLMRDGELVAGRLLHTADGGLFVPPRRGRERESSSVKGGTSRAALSGRSPRAPRHVVRLPNGRSRSEEASNRGRRAGSRG